MKGLGLETFSRNQCCRKVQPAHMMVVRALTQEALSIDTYGKLHI
jgi:hypothetical protein